MTGLAHTYPTSGEVQAIDRAQRDVQRLEKRAVEYAREPDTWPASTKSCATHAPAWSGWWRPGGPHDPANRNGPSAPTPEP